MFNRNNSVAAIVCLAASVAAFGQGNQGTANVFQLPGQNSSGTAVVAFGYNSSSSTPSINVQGPAGASRIIPKPDGTKFYIIGSSGLQVADANFSNIHAVAGVAGQPSAAAITLNGKYLIVGVASSLSVVDTSSDQVIGSNITVPSTVVSIATSQDSLRAYILTGNQSGSQVTTLSLLNLLVNQNQILNLTSLPTSITRSPLNLLYVTSANRIYEIDPSSLTVTNKGEIDLGGFTPGQLQFTSDGETAYAVNTDHSPSASSSLLNLNVSTRAISVWPPHVLGVQPTALDGVLVASGSRVFAFSNQTGILYDVTPGPPLTAVQSGLNGVVPVTNVVGAAVSNEIPSSRYLYELVLTGTQDVLYRVDLSTNQQSQQATSPVTGGVLQFVAVPPESGAVAPFVKFNNPQTVAAGTTSAFPFIARLLDSSGRPVYNQAITFTPDPNGVVNGLAVNPTTGTTNADGYVQTVATAPTVGGPYTIGIAAGAITDSFNLNVPGSGGGGNGGGGNSGGGGNNGNSQVSIVSGDGQIVYVGQQGKAPLTIQVLDTNGKPLANVPVTFAIDSGPISNLGNPFGVGSVCPTATTSWCTTTDAKGLATTYFSASAVPSNESFQAGFISATTSYGTVEFTETPVLVQLFNAQQASGPSVAWTPGPGSVITIPAGSSVPNAIVGTVTATDPPQRNVVMPGVSIQVLDPADPLNIAPSPAASCQGDPITDQMGTVSCTLVAGTCQLGEKDVFISFGYFRHFPATVNVVKGGASAFTKIAGDNQSGSAGKLLATTLTAIVTDGCGNPVSGTPVTWTVSQGSAALSSTVKASDSGGHVSTQVTLGQNTGSVQIKVALSTGESTTFQATANSVASSTVSILSGNNQTAPVSTTFAQPVSVVVHDSSNNPTSGVTVNFVVTSGSGSVGPTSVTTNAQGIASATAGAGATAGSITVTATYSTSSVAFTLTATPVVTGPTITPASFTSSAYNALSTASPGLAPCGISTVTGTGLVPTPGVIPANLFGPLPFFLGSVAGITVGGIAAPIEAVGNVNGVQTVNFQVPCEVPLGTATVSINANGSTTTVNGVTVAPAVPGVFNFTASSGKQYAAVIGSDGNYVTPSNPARRGGTYFAVVTGLGQVSPAASTDSVGVAGQNVNLPVVVGVANAGVPVVSAQYLPGATGVYLVGFQIPQNTPTGEQHFAVAAIVNGNLVFGNETFIAVN